MLQVGLPRNLWFNSQEIFSLPQHPEKIQDPPNVPFSGYHQLFAWR